MTTQLNPGTRIRLNQDVWCILIHDEYILEGGVTATVCHLVGDGWIGAVADDPSLLPDFVQEWNAEEGGPAGLFTFSLPDEAVVDILE